MFCRIHVAMKCVCVIWLILCLFSCVCFANNVFILFDLIWYFRTFGFSFFLRCCQYFIVHTLCFYVWLIWLHSHLILHNVSIFFVLQVFVFSLLCCLNVCISNMNLSWVDDIIIEVIFFLRLIALMTINLLSTNFL